MSSPLIAIVGSTATGKSEMAFHLAKQLNAEIVSADSWLVRKGLDIGTAKPSPSMLREIPHHLIDIIEPDQDFSAAEYKKLALKSIEGIQSLGRLPLLVGGTGLYIDAILYDFSFLPASEPKERQHLNSLSLSDLHSLAITQKLDLSQIDMRNKRRVIRFIESEGKMATKGNLRPDTLIIGIRSEPDVLREKIKERVELMMSIGLENEVKRLSELYGWQCEALKGIGYSEWELYFKKRQSLETTKARIIKDTIGLARRQQTWFKRNKSIHWFTTPVNIADVDALITTFLNNFIFE